MKIKFRSVKLEPKPELFSKQIGTKNKIKIQNYKNILITHKLKKVDKLSKEWKKQALKAKIND